MNDKNVDALNSQLGRVSGGGASASLGRVGSPGAGAAPPKTIVARLVMEKTLRTDGTATWTGELLDLPQLKYLGPMIARMRVHWECVNASANFQGRVSVVWSVSGRVWSTPVQIFGPQAGVGQVIGAWYSTDANFGLQMQYVIEASNTAGTAIENGRIIAFLEIELKS